jgi:hypothetical protein
VLVSAGMRVILFSSFSPSSSSSFSAFARWQSTTSTSTRTRPQVEHFHAITTLQAFFVIDQREPLTGTAKAPAADLRPEQYRKSECRAMLLEQLKPSGKFGLDGSHVRCSVL